MDNDERIMEKAMKCGVVRYIVEPATESDFKGIWQYAVHSIFMKGMEKQTTSSSSSPIIRDQENENCSVEDSWGSRFTKHHHDPRKKNKIVKRKEFVVRLMKNKGSSSESCGIHNGTSLSSRVIKKSKVVWTDDLQSRFLQAINVIGLENAVPKNILEVMNTPGLTRENVASHLQKYRLFLKRVARMYALVMNKGETDNAKEELSTWSSKYPKSLMLMNIKEEFRRMLKLRMLGASSSTYPCSSSSKNHDSSSKPLFNPSSNKFQFHHSTDLSSQMKPSHGPPLHDQFPPSTSSYNYANNFINNDDDVVGFTSEVLNNYYDYGGYNNSSINGSIYSNMIDGRVQSPASIELYIENQSSADMEGKYNNILEEQQEERYEALNNINEGNCRQTIVARGKNDASLVTSHCPNMNTGFAFDDVGNIFKQENNKCGMFSNEQDYQDMACYDLDDPRVEPNDDYLSSFGQIFDEEWADDFLESLLNSEV